jgi:hypothetical protein
MSPAIGWSLESADTDWIKTVCGRLELRVRQFSSTIMLLRRVVLRGKCTARRSTRLFSDASPRVPVAPKKKSKDARFVTVGLPLLLFVTGGYVTLTQVSRHASV